jgi:hypothetical protein
MLKRLREPGILIMMKYIVIGLFISVIIYQLITIGLINRSFDRNSLMDALAVLVGSYMGFIVGGLVFLAMWNPTDKGDQTLRTLIEKRGMQFLFTRNMFSFALGGFVYMFISTLFNTFDNNDGVHQSLFSSDNIIRYVAAVVAFIIFSIFWTQGTIKRLEQI